MRLMLFITIIFYGFVGLAAPTCENIFFREAAPSLADLALEMPEIEAKFLIPNPAAYENLKLLAGTEITLTDANGRLVVYKVEKNKEHIYEDTNYDTKDLALFKRRGMLRERIRYDLNPQDSTYEFKKAVFQAKDGPTENQGMQTAVYARNEIRGKEFKSLKKFEKKKEKRLGEDSNDLAVQFAREYSQSERKFKPVLHIKDVRYFLKLSPVNSSVEAPWFYISLDNVTYEGLKGRKDKATRLELEAEIGDDLNLDSNEVTQKKLVLMDRLSDYLAKKFLLQPSPESKYESGVQLTVLPK